MNDTTRRQTTGWIWLGIYALTAAGLLSLMLVFARTPMLQDLFPGNDFFHVALVVHVDLSVLVWFIACAGILWSLYGAPTQSVLSSSAFGLAVIGAVMISIAPFVGAARPLMNNYVPVLQHPWFYLGLGSLACGLVLQSLAYLANYRLCWHESGHVDVIRFGLSLAALTALLCVACVGWSYLHMPGTLAGKQFFEILFWGGGHVLQFANTVFVLIAWFLLVQTSGNLAWLNTRLGMALFALTALPLLSVPFIYQLGVATDEGILAFTSLMRWGGLASMPLGLVVLLGLFLRLRVPHELKPLRATVLCSLALFAAGGMIGFMIKGSNTMIPAHYHGSIVGVTLAFMGIVYYVLPRLGYSITYKRLIASQPYLYASGQLMHITGLAMSGGYGVARKVGGSEQVLDGLNQTLGMGMMGLGGLLAAIGGLCFIIITVAALRGGDKRRAVSTAVVGSSQPRYFPAN